MDNLKESISMMEQNVGYVELKTRIDIADKYVHSEKYPKVKIICLILGIDYEEED